ncbi:MAG: S26 family signal peptidase [Gemmataceae bacterium]
MPDDVPNNPTPPHQATTLELGVGWLIAQAVNLVFLVALWAVLALGLRAAGVEWANALGFGFLLSFFGGFLFRPLIVGALGKPLAARVPGLVQAQQPQPGTPVEGAREVVETVVFVVVLVLMLKSFVAEAFVIPTGSMAQTLWGYQKDVTCPKCGHRFPVNASDEAEHPRDENHYVRGCTCPNCLLKIALFDPHNPLRAHDGGIPIPDPGWVVPDSFLFLSKDGPGGALLAIAQNLLNGPRSGDRVLVSKYPYDLPGTGPSRLDVVVFKFPGDENRRDFPTTGPYKNHVPINYIKRLIGLPGETVAVHRGKVFVLPPPLSPKYPDDDKARAEPGKAILMWRTQVGDWLHVDDGKARDLFKDRKFSIVRKTPDVLTAMMRIVYDNDLPAKDLTGLDFQRWVPSRDAVWTEDADARAFTCGGGPDVTWLRYRHVLRDEPNKPQLITDFMGYNTDRPGRGGSTGTNWASDLIVECQVKADKAEGKFVAELSRGPDRFQAEFDAATGRCTLSRLRDGGKPEALGSAETKFKGPGTYDVRFANVDDRLTVWVNGQLPFGDGVAYESAFSFAPTAHNDMERPASLGAAGGRFTVKHLKLHRDTYYTASRDIGSPDVPGMMPNDPTTWGQVVDTPYSTYYVQPGHYLCLGDNSPKSADSRSWGLVPARLMLGRAVVVYFPFTRVGRIR